MIFTFLRVKHVAKKYYLKGEVNVFPTSWVFKRVKLEIIVIKRFRLILEN